MTARPHPEAGVTLLEVLIVLAVIGVATGATMLALPSGTTPRGAQHEADLLASRLELAAERALIFNRHAALDWDAGGYRFVEWNGTAWQPHASPQLAARHELPGAARLSGGTLATSGQVRLTPAQWPDPTADFSVALPGGALRIAFDGVTARVEGSP